jgi:alkanesulfonate monooxygenase SsuD/methylene tetrahydromethanopterin reductase-like flavin-dependent oxidoreductase (luciferase family)
MLDESLEILVAAWSVSPCTTKVSTTRSTACGSCRAPVQRPGVPVWVAGFYGKPGPLRRAARHDEFFPVNLEHPDQLAESVADITALRRNAGRAAGKAYDVVAAYARQRSGATWSGPEVRIHR